MKVADTSSSRTRIPVSDTYVDDGGRHLRLWYEDGCGLVASVIDSNGVEDLFDAGRIVNAYKSPRKRRTTA